MDAVAHAAPGHAERADWRARAWAGIRNRNARGWYFGAAFGLIYQVILVVSIWSSSVPLWQQALTFALLAVFYLAFMLLPPLFWTESRTARLAALAAYWAFSLVFFPLLGADTFWLWILVAAVAATLYEEFVLLVSVVGILVAVPLIYGFVTDFRDSVAISAPIIFSVAAMMYGVNLQTAAVRKLRKAQGEVARLAVVEERARFSRDMHDVLGHSLTVVTVKSELARKLVSRDPARAEQEIADIERLARAALADLRSAVTGYRAMSLSTELAVAQASLAAANIQAHLPRSGDVVAADLRGLFGWVLREGVTNVIRHSGAHTCWIELDRDSLTITDDGHRSDDSAGRNAAIQPSDALSKGTGLRGLAERAAAVGAVVRAEPGARGGFQLAVERGHA